MFVQKRMIRMFLPIFIETMSISLLGMVSGIMVSHVSEFAMSAVSIVETFNAVVMNLFIAIAAGVTVKISQYIGRGSHEDACRVAEQSILLSTIIGAVLGGIIVLFGKPILGFLFGNADENIINAAGSYLTACAVSYPFYAIFSTCNSVFRGVGDYKITLFSGIVINVLHAVMSAIMIFGLNLGVLGVGISLVITRGICGAMNYWILKRGTNLIRIRTAVTKLESDIVKAVLRISIPSGIDSMVFNGGRLLVQTFIVASGSVAVAANAIGNNISGFLLIPGNAVATMVVTIVGQSFGAGDIPETRKHMWNNILASSVLEFALCLIALAFLKPLVGLYNPSPEVAAQSYQLILLVIICYPVLWSLAFVSPAALRATGDVKYTTIISIASMWTTRVFGAWLLSVQLGLGVMGVWYAMVLDWMVRSAFYIPRIMSKKWERLDRI